MALPGPDIPNFTLQSADIAGGMTKGFQLGELFRKQQADNAVRGILQSSDLSTPEGQAQAAQKVSAYNPQLGMQMMGQVRSQQEFQTTQQYHRDLMAERQENLRVRQQEEARRVQDAQAKVTTQRLTTVSENTARIYDDYEDTKADYLKEHPGKDKDAEIFAKQKVNEDWGAWRGGLEKQVDEQGNALFPPNMIAGIPQHFDPTSAKNLTGWAKQGMDMVSAHQKEQRKADVEARKQAEPLTPVAKANADFAAGRISKEQRDNLIARDTAPTTAMQATGGFTQQSGELLAALTERGVSLPAGFRSKAQQVATVNALLAKHPDKTPDQIADMVKNGQIDLAGEKKEVMTAATQVGKIAVAQNEIRQFGPIVLEASANIPRGRFVPWNRLKQIADEKISDPNLKQFKTQMRALENAYESLASRGGTDVAKREHIATLFNTADSPEAVRALVEALNVEAAGAERAARAAMVPPTRAPAGAPAAPGATPAAGGLPAGWSVQVR